MFPTVQNTNIISFCCTRVLQRHPGSECHAAEQQAVCADLVEATKELKKAANYFSDAREFKADHEEKPLTASTFLTILGVGADALKKAKFFHRQS